MTKQDASWRAADLVAIDLEGSGPGDPMGEAILEIALVPMKQGLPDSAGCFSTMINPGRRIRRGPWISPGLTSDALALAPLADDVRAEIVRGVSGKILVGHNVGVDWRLLRQHYPVEPVGLPVGLIDTMKLARFLHPEHTKRVAKESTETSSQPVGHSLSAWIRRLDLTQEVTLRAAESGERQEGERQETQRKETQHAEAQPHRALWDAIAAAMLLDALLSEPGADAVQNLSQSELPWLIEVAGVPLTKSRQEKPVPSQNPGQQSSSGQTGPAQTSLW
jgi:DNA polymerase III epsilon subunit-like protein